MALIKQVMTATWLERDKIKVEPVWVDTPLEALEAVSLRKAEACIENLAAASYLVQKNGLFNLKIAAPTSWGERIRSQLANIAVEFEGQTIRFTVGLGLAVLQEKDDTLVKIMSRADSALYKAKEEGRNRLASA